MQILKPTPRQLKIVGATVFAVALMTPLGAYARETIAEGIEQYLADNGDRLIELRRDLHRHPEIAGQEKRTAAVIAKHLSELGLEVQADIGGFGVVGILRGGSPGPVVAYRADMDALVSNEQDPAPFASENPGLRHGCGHDIHVTIGLGIAGALAETADDLAGTVKFLFQPAEETAAGARAMIADGAMSDPAPEAIYAVHCAPLPVGLFGSRAGMLLPGLDIIHLSLSGKGDLAAAAEAYSKVISSVSTVDGPAPKQDGDPMAAAMVPGDFAMAAVFQSSASEAGWQLTGMVRASSDEMHSLARQTIESRLATLELADIAYELEYDERAIAAVDNDVELTRRGEAVIREVGGEAAVSVIEETTPFFSEDFAFFQQEAPGVMFFLGVANEAEGHHGLPHHPEFNPDEAAINVGVRTMALMLVDFLEGK